MRPRRHPVRTAALAGVVVIILIPLLGDRGHGSSSKSAGDSGLPSGAWGKTIGCLRYHPLYGVYDAYSQNASKPGPRTKAVSVWQNLKGVALAYVGNNTLGADDLTGSGDARVTRTDGPIHYGFSKDANGANQRDIIGCITANYG